MSSLEFIARAVIRRGDKVLLAHRIGEANTFLPGGHVEEREYSKDALVRELLEELGVDAVIGDFIGVLEHKFTDRHGKAYEEVNIIFEASIVQDDYSSVEGHLEFIWVSLNEFEARKLLPSSLPKLLKEWDKKRVPFHSQQSD